jgi:hypothetical protein
VKNITVSLDDQTAAWVRVEAAREGLSVSRYLGGVLRERNQKLGEYERAMHRFLNRPRLQLKPIGGKYPTREELYDRPGIR